MLFSEAHKQLRTAPKSCMFSPSILLALRWSEKRMYFFYADAAKGTVPRWMWSLINSGVRKGSS